MSTAARHSEVERKYDIDPGCRVPDLISLPDVARVAAPVEHHQVATYYDTPDLRLLSSRVTLRRRTGGTDDGWHLKLPAPGDRREEVRIALTDPSAVPEPLMRRVRGIVRDRAVAPVAVISTHRRVHRLFDEEGKVLAELCDDHVRGEVSSSSTSVEEWREWEVELVSGRDEFLDRVEPALTTAGARPAVAPAKVARLFGSRLRSGPSWRAREEVGDAPTAAELLTAFLATHLARLQHQDLLLRTGDQEGVHQLRVAARRMRSALATYARVLPSEPTAGLRADLKWLGGALAKARDAQVLREQLPELVDDQPDELVLGPVRARIDDELRTAWNAGRAIADEALESGRYFRLLDSLEEFVDRPPSSESVDRLAREVVPSLLRKDLKRVRRRARAYEDADSQHGRDLALHEIRKSAKRLRYAAEAARPVFGKRAKRLASRAKDVQSLLGEHQDTVVARAVLRDIGVRAFLAGENGFSFGRLHAVEEARASQLEAAHSQVVARLERLRSKLPR